MDHTPFDYDIKCGEPVILGKSVISVKVSVTLPNGKTSEANGTASVVGPDGEIDGDSVLYAVREAQSTGLKLALKNFGMGLHLYFGHDDEERPSRATQKTPAKSKPRQQEPEDEEEEEAPAPKRSTKPSSNGKSDWSSKREKFTVPMGKNKGDSYSVVDSGWLQWAVENIDPDDEKYGEQNKKILNCVKSEIKYRKDNGEWNPEAGRKKSGSTKPTKKRSISDDDPDDF